MLRAPSEFYTLLFRRAAPVFCAGDVLSRDGRDLRGSASGISAS